MTESQHTAPSFSRNDEIDLRRLFRVLWAGKWLIAGITSAATMVAIIVALLLPNIYRAEALLSPSNQQSNTGLSALAAQYGGLASLAGISLDTGVADKTTLGIEILKSRKFISEFIERHDILVSLIAADGWNAETNELIVDTDIYDVDSGQWVRKVRPPKKAIPSSQEAYDEFMEILSVGRDKKTGYVTVAVEHYSPHIAKQWVDWLVEDINLTIMQQDVAEAEAAIEYLNRQVAKTSLADLQSVFFGLIEEQTKTVMLARVSNEYLFKTLDPAVAPELKTKPKRSLIVVLAMMLGALFGVGVQLIRPKNFTFRERRVS